MGALPLAVLRFLLTDAPVASRISKSSSPAVPLAPPGSSAACSRADAVAPALPSRVNPSGCSSGRSLALVMMSLHLRFCELSSTSRMAWSARLKGASVRRLGSLASLRATSSSSRSPHSYKSRSPWYTVGSWKESFSWSTFFTRSSTVAVRRSRATFTVAWAHTKHAGFGGCRREWTTILSLRLPERPRQRYTDEHASTDCPASTLRACTTM
mmetsp:Transcript_16512/g.55518  ORF Transcript_16512/g.55518 Transcript_16512/m.55518 type:complete len:212 (+) Transcript_16512:349-984(+)